MRITTKIIVVLYVSAILFGSCSKTDIIAPIILLHNDTTTHYFGEPYIDAGGDIADDKSCNLDSLVIIDSNIDIYHYGTYTITYQAEDEAGNIGIAEREVDIILKPSDYYSLSYNASDTCSTGNYYYTGLVQDCDCSNTAITIGNISNFGLSALFTLEINGRYNQKIILDTTRFAITFLGDGIMTPGTDTIRWNYTISDSIISDVCVSTWIKN
ncbi:MAG: DUF5011 domain-containing protein [Fimbriimonadaceae bacterium]|nr:DUF5011 domain-containing protein [Chitinophagales bacterium]